jgi:hypothetical protein
MGEACFSQDTQLESLSSVDSVSSDDNKKIAEGLEFDVDNDTLLQPRCCGDSTKRSIHRPQISSKPAKKIPSPAAAVSKNAAHRCAVLFSRLAERLSELI